MLPQCVSLIIWRWVNSGNQPYDIEVLLAQRSWLLCDDPSCIKGQNFFGGWQICPSGELGDDESSLLNAAWSKLRDYGGVRAMVGLVDFIDDHPARLRQVDPNCFAVEIRESDKFDGDSDFLNLVNLSPNYVAIAWKSLAEILHFSDLAPYRNGVPKGVEAIFKDQLDLIKKLADQVRRIK